MESETHPNKEKASDKGQTSACNCLKEHSAYESVADANRKNAEFISYGLFEQQVLLALLHSLNVDVCCSGAPRTKEAAPAISLGLGTQSMDTTDTCTIRSTASHHSNDILCKKHLLCM